MGKLIDSPLEGSSGRVGRFVVANVGGVEIIRRRPRDLEQKLKYLQTNNYWYANVLKTPPS
jgi:hypothetical protein